MGGQAAKAAQGGDQQDAAHADSADEAADEQGDSQKDDDRDVLRCDVVHKQSKQCATKENFFLIYCFCLFLVKFALNAPQCVFAKTR